VRMRGRQLRAVIAAECIAPSVAALSSVLCGSYASQGVRRSTPCDMNRGAASALTERIIVVSLEPEHPPRHGEYASLIVDHRPSLR